MIRCLKLFNLYIIKEMSELNSKKYIKTIY